MKLLFLGFFLLFQTNKNTDTWSQVQLDEANTASQIPYLSAVEKDIILYLNLARLYPKKFVAYELTNYQLPKEFKDNLSNSKYKKSLITTLSTLKPLPALSFDAAMYEEAKCLSTEQYKLDTRGHNRVNCISTYNGECCSYGMQTGLDIVVQLLIDHNIPSLGHRKICLSPQLNYVGASYNLHKTFRNCAVIDFKM